MAGKDSKIGGVPDAADDKGLDEAMGDVVNGSEEEALARAEEEPTVKVGGLTATKAEDGVEELTVENVMEDSFIR